MSEALRPTVLLWLDRWGCLPDGEGFATDDAYIWPVRRADAPLMLKVADPQGDEIGQGAVLAALDGRGAVRLVAQAGHVTLTHRVLPGGADLRDMALTGQDDAATGVMADLTLQMQGALRGADLPGLIPLDRWVRAAHGHATDARLPPDLRALLDWAEGFVREMVADRSQWTALHGDMHHRNVLHDSNLGWLSIDPKGIFGPPLYDFANTLLNPLPYTALVHDPGRMARQAAIVAERTGTLHAEVLTWTCLQGLLGMCWSLWDDERDYWLTGARLAGHLSGLRLPA